MTHSKNKGKAGELELARELSRLFGVETRRGVQYQGGPDSPDVVGLSGVHVECKRMEHFGLYRAMKQAASDAGESVPIVCHRKNGEKWLAIVQLDDLPKLAAQLYLILAEYA